jgi:hypothetical protein
VPRLVAPGGLCVLHLARPALPERLPGEVVAVSYAPGFAVVWWRPGSPARYVAAKRDLTVERPHVDWQDRDAALS